MSYFDHESGEYIKGPYESKEEHKEFVTGLVCGLFAFGLLPLAGLAGLAGLVLLLYFGVIK